MARAPVGAQIRSFARAQNLDLSSPPTGCLKILVRPTAKAYVGRMGKEFVTFTNITKEVFADYKQVLQGAISAKQVKIVADRKS